MLVSVLTVGCSDGGTTGTTIAERPSTTGAPATSTTIPPTTTTLAPSTTTTQLPITFETGSVMEYVRSITAFGPRPEGGPAERAAADYAERTLKDMGYDVVRQSFTLPTGKTCQNLIVDIPGATSGDEILVIGGHIDSVRTTPGANDDALGVAIVMELARIYKQQPPRIGLRLIVFGAEEYAGAAAKARDEHHLGSRYYVRTLPVAERKKIAGMISIDMVGYGKTFKVRSLGRGSKAMCNALISQSESLGVPMVYEKKPEWSDHEAFEKAGIPSAWLYVWQDPTYHGPKDTPTHLDPDNIAFMGKLLPKTIEAMGR